MKYFKEVSLKNFFSFGPQEQTLDLTGKDIWNISASNGVGKTALCVESITFAIYGKTRQEKIDDVVNRAIGKNCKVGLTFIGDDDEEYKIIRYRKHDTHGNSVFLFKGDKDISCKNAKDTDSLIQDYVGMPYIAFANSTIFSSELYSNFLSAKNSERLEIFENILSLKEINLFYLECKKILKELDKKEQENKIYFTEKNTEKETIAKTITDYNANAKQKLLELKAKKENLISEIESKENKLKELSVINIKDEKAKAINSKLLEEYKQQLEELVEEELPKDPLESKALINKYKDFDFNKNREAEKEFKENEEKYKKHESNLLELKNRIRELLSEISSLENEEKNLSLNLEAKNKELEKIKDSICPYCGQKMGEKETSEKRDAVNKEIEELKNKISKNFSSKEALITEGDDLSKDEKTLEEIISKKPIIEFVENTDLLEERYNNAKAEVERFDKQLLEIGIHNADVVKKQKDIKDKISKLDISKYSEAFLNSLEEQIEELKSSLEKDKSSLEAITPFAATLYDKEYISGLTSSMKEKEKEAEEYKNQIADLEKDEKYYKYLSEVFSNKSGGFKKYFIGQMIDVFNDKVNQYLPFFFNSDTVSINFSKDLSDVIEFNGKQISFSSLSCGQKTRAELTIAFSLFAVSRIFFSNKSGLLIVDEMLDRGLDSYGIKSALSVLQAFAEDTKVFVVSHNPILKDELENIIDLKKDENGFAVIKK